jgi:Holliday junction resolvase RusA-like endonuclease
MVTAMNIRLPAPPSTNNLFINVRSGGRILSPAYRSWRTHAGHLLNLARVQPFGVAPVQIGLMVPRKPASRDIDNFSKAPIDLLVAHAIIADDKQVERLTIERHDDADILLTVMPYSGVAGKG